MRNLVVATIFRIIQIILLTIGAVAYVPFVVKLVRFSRRLCTSPTVLASLYTRYMQHRLGMRPDEPCDQLSVRCPDELRCGSGAAPPGINQFVVLGAGFDTRAYRLPAGMRVRCFEVGKPKTQGFKSEMLKKAGVDTTRVTYVPADFLEEDWFEKLVDAGFEADKPSFFLWESVTMYLDREAVESTLRKIAGTATGGVVAFEYFSAEIIEARSLFMRYARAVINATHATNEPGGSVSTTLHR